MVENSQEVEPNSNAQPHLLQGSPKGDVRLVHNVPTTGTQFQLLSVFAIEQFNQPGLFSE